MPYAPTQKFLQRVALAQRAHAVFVLVVDQAPVNWCSNAGGVRPKAAGGSDWDTAAKPMVCGSLSVGALSGNTVVPKDGRFTVGTQKLTILDVGGWATRWQATEVDGTRIYLRDATLYVGTADMHEDEYQVLFKGLVEDTPLSSGGGAYDVTLVSRVRRLEEEIMTAAENISGSCTERFSDTVLDGDSDLSTEDDYYNGWTLEFTSGAAEGESHVISDYLGSNAKRLTLPGSGSTGYVVGDSFTLTNLVTIVGNPLDIYARILLGDFALSGTVQTDYPLFSVTGNPTGLSFVAADLDKDGIQEERDTWLADVVFELKWSDSEKAKKTLEEQIFKVIGGYPTVTPDGLLSARMARPQVPPVTPFEIEEHHVEKVPRRNLKRGDLVNKVVVMGDWNPSTDNYQELASVEVNDSRYTPAALGVTNLLEIKSRGLVTSRDGVNVATALANRILARQGLGGPEEVALDGGRALALLEAGERVLLTHSELPSVQSATLGKAREAFEVVKASPDLAKGKTRLTMERSYIGQRPAFIAPRTASRTYDDATPTEKESYCYISPSSGNFDDGGAPYVVI